LANISHELRTPLNAIVGFSQMMHNEMLGPLGTKAYRGYARDIETSSQQLLDRIQRILDLSQMESGDLSLAMESVSLDQAVDEAVRAKHLHAGAAGVDISATMAGSACVLADRSALIQSIMNVIGVAIETTASNEQKAGRVTVSATTDAEGVTLSIADNGRALDRNDVPAGLADRGFVAEREATNSPEGVGDATSVSISLLLADRLAVLSGARLTWHFVEGRGKLFHLALAKHAEGSDRNEA
jgi:two-component system cell cycle sensor histidine kinase PleC